jgi:hypothetical protein
MFRGPGTGNRERSNDYSHVVPLFGAAGSGRRVPENGLPATDWPAGRAWGGAGGRWMLWPLRAALWAALLIIAYRGVTAIVFGQAGSPQAGEPKAAGVGDQFPVVLAEAYATEFGQVYLNASPATRAQREQQLAAFVPPGVAAADPDLGWGGTGRLNLASEQVSGIAVQDPRHAVVTLLATVDGQLMELGVPVIASAGGMAVTGQPAWLPAPPQISLPVTAGPGSDPVARGELMNELPAFFQAYAAGDNTALGRFELRGASLTGLAGAVDFGSISSLQVPPGGSTRQITATVIWRVPGQGADGITKLAMTYRMSVVDLQSGKWYVNEISAATEAVGAK